MRILTALALFAAGLMSLLACGRPATSTGPVVVPYYGATYGGAGLSAADGKRIVELLESIDNRLEAIEAKTGGPAAGLKKGPDLLAVAKHRCAGCHTPGKSEARGGGFILFADDAGGAMKPLSGREKARIKESVQGGTMPPTTKLSPAEKAAFEW